MKWLANLLANEQALQPLLELLKSTEVGSRERAAERDEEWEMRMTGREKKHLETSQSQPAEESRGYIPRAGWNRDGETSR